VGKTSGNKDADDACSKFVEAYKTLLAQVDIKDDNPPKLPTSNEEIKKRIVEASCSLPASYREAYVNPLLDNLKYVVHLKKANDFFDAVCDHHPDNAPKIKKPIRCFVAVNSNLYRSFGISGQRKVAVFPPIGQLPPLATFSRKKMEHPLDLYPQTLAVDEVELNCGGKVAVVVMPFFYRKYPILWGILAHETGGHGVLHADPALLPELQDALSETFREELRGETQIDGPCKELLEELWRYWLEETASNVYGVLNIGPIFGKGAAVYFAAMIQLGLKMVSAHPAKDLNGKVLEELRERAHKGEQQPDLNPPYGPVPPDPNWFIDTHPPLILWIHATLGAIDALDKLRDDERMKYLRELEAVATQYGKSKTNNKMKISGVFRVTQGTWRRVDSVFPHDLMLKYARIVGKLIATVPLEVLGGRSFREIETWDGPDEKAADDIRKAVMEGAYSIALMGDDAHLLAGSLLALFENPDSKSWKIINVLLIDALNISFGQDEIWRVVSDANFKIPCGQRKGSPAARH
jgi:hypothetical protein